MPALISFSRCFKVRDEGSSLHCNIVIMSAIDSLLKKRVANARREKNIQKTNLIILKTSFRTLICKAVSFRDRL